MTRNNRLVAFVGSFFVSLVPITSPTFAQIERFRISEGEAIEVWRITNDPTVRDHANYHNTQCWSPDGRYICYTHYAADGREFGAQAAAEVHLYDLHKDQDVKVDNGTNPRWANKHNWLFYTRFRPEDGPSGGERTRVMWLDVATDTRTPLAHGVGRLKETDCGDRWLYGVRSLDDGVRRALRIPIQAGSGAELLPGGWGVGYNSLFVNPVHPLIVSRDHHFRDYLYATEGTRDVPFVARHFFDHDLDGKHATSKFPIMEGSHFSWIGDGSYFLAGNGQARGRKWNEPLPSNIHFLAGISLGDISPCGFSGRWICGSTYGGRGPLQLADTRSGDGWVVLKTHSFLCFPNSEDHSGPYDIDAKGSPDGTKIAFISTYDLKDGPATEITEDVTGSEIKVKSTAGFPQRGRLIHASGFGGEVIGYQRKTKTSFERLTRALYGTSQRPLSNGQSITSFEAMLIPEAQRRGLPLPPGSIRRIIKDMDSPLMRQRSSDLYVAVVRRPDRPHLQKSANRVQLIPGENHWETFGYHVFRGGRRSTTSPLRPGTSFRLPSGGTYTAAAVEWSGLESKPSLPLKIQEAAVLEVLPDKPSEFSWTRDRYLVNGKQVSAEQAKSSAQAVREIVHLHDGVIHREWWKYGEITRRHDLNLEGMPIRRLFFEGGKLARREYHDRTRRHVSTELFTPDGYITESMQYGGSGESRHWWYERGVPVKYRSSSEVYIKDGSRWLKKQLDTPERGPANKGRSAP